MKNSILNITGIQKLDKNELKSIKGSIQDFEYDCYTQYNTCDEMWPNNHDNFVKCMKGC